MTLRAVRLDPVVTKSDLLLWDEIAIVGLDRKLTDLAGRDPAAAADIDFLATRGIVVPLPATLNQLRRYLWELNVGPFRVATELSIKLPEQMAVSGSPALHAELSSDPELGEGFEQVIAVCERRAGYSSVPLLRRRPPAAAGTNRRSTPVMQALLPPFEPMPVVDLIVRRLPTPGYSVPLERILEFRAEERTQWQLSRLRSWMANVSSAEQSMQAAATDLETLLSDYQEFMDLRRLESRLGVLRALVSLPAGIAEDLLHLRFAGAANRVVDAAFSLTVARVNLAKAEQEAPGRAVAYLDRARRRFEATAASGRP